MTGIRLRAPILDPHELFLLIINGVGWAGFLGMTSMEAAR